ncbi:MAG: hypothetical protein JO199_08910 [Candidatus Eremiobacteraeota bacterium]|nr:hypothetical protein [Candidatus Eremiobacteraeota bacterium]
MLLIAGRALLPNIGVSDPVWYHLAYAQDWVLAKRLVVDPYMVFPFYANNFLLLIAALIELKAAIYVNFLIWSTGLLSALGVYATIAMRHPERSAEGAPLKDGLWKHAIALLAAFSLMLTTTFLDHSVQAYIDVPIGTTALLSITAIVLGLRTRETGWLIAAAVIGGFLVGMKGSFAALVPLYIAGLVWACLSLKLTRRNAIVVVAAFCIAGAPWYARNLVLAGDPVPPVLNLALYHDDGLIPQNEWDQLEADLSTSHSPRALVTLPVRAYWDPASQDFREYGVTFAIVLLYIPTLVWLLALALRKPLPNEIAIPILFLTGFIVYWIGTSTLLRYADLFYPLLAVCLGMLLIEATARWPRALPAAVAIAFLAALPSPGDDWLIEGFIHDDFLNDVHSLTHNYDQQTYLAKNESGYREEQVLSDWMRDRGYGGNVYVIGTQLDYYFRRDGVISNGDYTGPAGFFRLLKAIDEGRAAEFLDDLNTHAVMMTPMNLIDAGVQRLLAEQLEKGGYREIPAPDKSYRLFVRTG